MEISSKTDKKRILVVIAFFQSGNLVAADYAILPTVTVSGNYVHYASTTWYSPDYSSEMTSGGGGGGGIGAGAAMMNARDRAFDLSKVCIAPVSAGARSTTSRSDVTDRWLAAQEVFNIIQARNLFNLYSASIGGLRFLMDNTMYRGFKVTYSDGWIETWAVTPNHATSVVKLIDQPLPNSLRQGLDRGCMS